MGWTLPQRHRGAGVVVLEHRLREASGDLGFVITIDRNAYVVAVVT